MDPKDNAAQLARELAGQGIEGFDVVVILGSGLGGFADRLEGARAVDFAAVGSMPSAGVPGHSGRWVLGSLDGSSVLVQQGRVHLYEGRTAEEVTRAVRAYAELGARGLVLTNAAGGLVADHAPPCLMRIEDHVNMQGVTPLTREEAGRANPYDERLGELLERVARERDVDLQRGVYVGLPGPSYETPAEVRMLARLEVHAVGMSTVCEAVAGHASGMAVAGISCISNHGAGISAEPLDHAEVVAAGNQIAPLVESLLEAAVPEIARALAPDGAA